MYSIGTLLSFFANYYQEHLYRKNVATRGPEARLYAAMLGGILFAVGCFIYAWTCESFKGTLRTYADLHPSLPAYHLHRAVYRYHHLRVWHLFHLVGQIFALLSS